MKTYTLKDIEARMSPEDIALSDKEIAEDLGLLTEADEDEMTDDELDALDARERDEFEARLKSRRDRVSQARADREAKALRDKELKERGQELINAIGDDWSFEHVFDTLVPNSGKCDTLAGELVRAANKLDYRWYNDGDRWFEDYGIETCGQPAYFIMNFKHEDETPFWDIVSICAEDNKDNDEYDDWINHLRDFIIDYIRNRPELFAMETEDMYQVASVSEVEEFLDDNNLIPRYETNAEIPPELEAHLDKNISERDLIWEVQSWIENMGNSTDDVEVSYNTVYIYGLSKADFDELDDNLYQWLEKYAEQLTDEYGDPNEEDSSEWAIDIANELGQDVDMVQNVLDTHKFDSYDDALDYIKDLIEEEAEEDKEDSED